MLHFLDERKLLFLCTEWQSSISGIACTAWGTSECEGTGHKVHVRDKRTTVNSCVDTGMDPVPTYPVVPI